MLVGNLAITLNLLSIAVLAFAISVVFIAVISPFTLHRIAQFTFGIRKVILWSLVTAPWWIAISCVGFFWPRQQDIFPAAWLNEFAHWHHVDIFSFTSWHAVTLLSASAYLLWSVTRTVYIRRKQSSAMADLIGLSDIKLQHINGKQGYYSLPLPIPAAFTTGLLSPKIYVLPRSKNGLMSRNWISSSAMKWLMLKRVIPCTKLSLRHLRLFSLLLRRVNLSSNLLY